MAEAPLPGWLLVLHPAGAPPHLYLTLTSRFISADEIFAVMFKLQQMQAVNRDLLRRLCSRFAQLDLDRTGLLKVGRAA